jgi:hypothetical protein
VTPTRSPVCSGLASSRSRSGARCHPVSPTRSPVCSTNGRPRSGFPSLVGGVAAPARVCIRGLFTPPFQGGAPARPGDAAGFAAVGEGADGRRDHSGDRWKASTCHNCRRDQGRYPPPDADEVGAASPWAEPPRSTPPYKGAEKVARRRTRRCRPLPVTGIGKARAPVRDGNGGPGGAGHYRPLAVTPCGNATPLVVGRGR